MMLDKAGKRCYIIGTLPPADISLYPMPKDDQCESEPLVKRTFLISAAEVDRFKARHRGHGDLTWFIRTALKKYNDLNDIDLEELVELAVKEIHIPS